MIRFSPSSFQSFFRKKNLILFLLVLFRIKPRSSQPHSSFNSYETSNYAAIQVAFHKTQCCPLEHGEVLYELKGQAACFQVEQIHYFFPCAFALFQIKSHFWVFFFKCILINQIRQTNNYEQSWQITTKSCFYYVKFSLKSRTVITVKFIDMCCAYRYIILCIILTEDKATGWKVFTFAVTPLQARTRSYEQR